MAIWAHTRWLILSGLLTLISPLMAAQQLNSDSTTLDSIVDAMERAQSEVRPQLSYAVTREYQLSGANRPSADSDIVVQVDFKPPSSKNYTIQKSSGSNRGLQVVRRILDHEVEETSQTSGSKAAVDRRNYDFTYASEAQLDGRDCYVLTLTPKRKDKDLVAGQAWVDKSSFAIRRVEGDLVKTPSWWLKRVHVRLTFAEFKGTWLQTGMEAMADVRFVGPHTLTSRTLDYRPTNLVAFVNTPSRRPNSQNLGHRTK
jgi:hypothetical protein